MLCAYTNRMKRNQKAWTLFIRESGNFTWRRFVDDKITYCLLSLKMLEGIVIFSVSHQATNLSSNGSLLKDTREPKENRVRSMATQLLAKFESTPGYTVRNSRVKKKRITILASLYGVRSPVCKSTEILSAYTCSLFGFLSFVLMLQVFFCLLFPAFLF